MAKRSRFRIMSIDMSFSSSGFCIMECGECDEILDAYRIESGTIGGGFDNLKNASKKLKELMDSIEFKIQHRHVDLLIIEMPCNPQSSRAAVGIGLLWGAISKLENVLLVEPSLLKIWSESKRGDGKEKVKEKVYSMVHTKERNDDILDAIGIALAFSQEVAIQRYANQTN